MAIKINNMEIFMLDVKLIKNWQPCKNVNTKKTLGKYTIKINISEESRKI